MLNSAADLHARVYLKLKHESNTQRNHYLKHLSIVDVDFSSQKPQTNGNTHSPRRPSYFIRISIRFTPYRLTLTSFHFIATPTTESSEYWAVTNTYTHTRYDPNGVENTLKKHKQQTLLAFQCLFQNANVNCVTIFRNQIDCERSVCVCVQCDSSPFVMWYISQNFEIM